MTDDSNKRQPLLEAQETTALLSLSNDTNNSNRDRHDTELSLSRLKDNNVNHSTHKSCKNLNPHTSDLSDDEKHINIETSATNNATAGVLIRSLSPQGMNENVLEQHNELMDINMTVSVQKSDQTANTEITEDASQFYETQGGGKIYIDPSYIPRHFDDDNDELNDLRKTTHNKIKLELDPSWTPFERYKSDLCFIFLSVCMDLCAIIITLFIFIVKDELGNEVFGNIQNPKSILDNENETTNPYPTGYEILRCLFIPLFVYIINRCLHFVISKSIKYLYLHGEKTLFVTLRAIEECNRHFIDICMVFVFGTYIYIICNYWYSQNVDERVSPSGWFDKFINEDIWLNGKHMDTKSITWFMFIIFMIIYSFDIYCSLHYGYIYYRFYHYARYNSIKRKGGRYNNHNLNLDHKSSNQKKSNEKESQEFDSNNQSVKSIHDGNHKPNEHTQNGPLKYSNLGVMHINKSIISDNSSIDVTEPTVSVMTLEDVHNINDFNYKDYNPHIHDDIATLKVKKYNKKKNKLNKKQKKQKRQTQKYNPQLEEKKQEETLTETVIQNQTTQSAQNLKELTQKLQQKNIDEYGSRHYSLFEQNKIYKKSMDETTQREDVVKLNEYSKSKPIIKPRRKRSRSESDLAQNLMLSNQRNNINNINNINQRNLLTLNANNFEIVRNNSVTSEIVSPINDNHSSNQNINQNNAMMELREKVNFLKATLFAKQSILDQFKLDLNEQTFIIKNLSLKMKRIELEKHEIEKELMDKNEELDEKKILLQVAEDTQKELEKECNRLSEKLKQVTKSAKSSILGIGISHENMLLSNSQSNGSKKGSSKKKKKNK